MSVMGNVIAVLPLHPIMKKAMPSPTKHQWRHVWLLHAAKFKSNCRIKALEISVTY
jgi:hypothetical protein